MAAPDDVPDYDADPDAEVDADDWDQWIADLEALDPEKP